MRGTYERLGAILAMIKPRNERARTWLDKLIFRCLENSKRDLDKFANAASIQSLSHDWDILMLLQGDDPKQKHLYAEVEKVLIELKPTTDWALP
jgi:hypothetical protein